MDLRSVPSVLGGNGNNVIAGNYIGTDASGTSSLPLPNNTVGVYVASAKQHHWWNDSRRS